MNFDCETTPAEDLRAIPYDRLPLDEKIDQTLKAFFKMIAKVFGREFHAFRNFPLFLALRRGPSGGAGRAASAVAAAAPHGAGRQERSAREAVLQDRAGGVCAGHAATLRRSGDQREPEQARRCAGGRAGRAGGCLWRHCARAAELNLPWAGL